MSLLPSSSLSSALTVVVPPSIHCTGGFVEGEVQLNFRHLQEEDINQVHIALRGEIQSRARRGRRTYEENHLILNTSLPLWSKGSAYPPPGLDIFRLPFRFHLPEGIPPSFHYSKWYPDIGGSVVYVLETTGVREGLLKVNKRIPTPIVVTPRDEIRKGIWGEYATARVVLSIPDVPVLPLFAELPFVIDITTTTAPLARAKADALPPDKPIFPAPPVAHSEIQFRLYRNLVLSPKGYVWTTDDAVACFFGAGIDARDVVADIDLPEKQWVVDQVSPHDGEEKGSWVQRSVFTSKFTLNLPPTFVAPGLTVQYYLSLEVPFPGIGNDIRIQVPVVISSGITESMPRSQTGQPQSQPQRSSLPLRQPDPVAISSSSASDAGSDVRSPAAASGPAPAYKPRSPKRDLSLPPEYWEAANNEDGGHLDQEGLK
ncbi:hypothetical protein BD309DRAFT_40979 [Dichomitus squalens]|nr:hypothetical protein BD309DRAFT_40979 [Dichomitus squalens]